jgi:hypothetical protein
MMACQIFILQQTATVTINSISTKGILNLKTLQTKAGVAGTSDWCSGATMADVNGDGLLDIYVSAVANAWIEGT